jgi:hypothetical protein
LNALRARPQPSPSNAYRAMLWFCLQQPASEPGTVGPNGALLCTILAHQLGRPLRLWLNDIPDGHCGNALPGLEAIEVTVQRVLGLDAPPDNPGYRMRRGMAGLSHQVEGHIGGHCVGRLRQCTPTAARMAMTTQLLFGIATTHAVCNVRTPEGRKAGAELARDLEHAVDSAWRAWFRTIDRTPDDLKIKIMSHHAV